ncbi:MAG TPA: ABC transporter permease [Vicinamibacterales bacterium]|jgi:putative ABC transport system permease protein
MKYLLFDLRDAFRSLRRDRGYTVTVVLTFALTLGAATTVFSIVNSILLKPLAYREPDRLVALREVWEQLADRLPTVEVNEQHFEYWRQHAQSFESMAQYIVRPTNLTGAGEAAQIEVMHASSPMLDVLRIQPAIGRALAAGDEQAGRPAVALISDGFWRQRLSTDPAVLGRSIVLDGRPHVVVGVLPAGVRLLDRDRLTSDVDAIVPIRLDDDHVGWAGDHNNGAVARLRNGVTLAQARAELDVLQRQVSIRATEDAHEPVTLDAVVRHLDDVVVGSARQSLLLLLGSVFAVLLVACSNLANLSLTRATGRVREASIRTALGATRARLVSGAILEQLMLAVVGGALGLWLASSAIALFVKTAPTDLPRASDVALDGRVLMFALALSVLAALFVAIVPAWRMSGREAQADLRSVSTTATGDGRALRARSALLVMQVAVSVTLLVVTGLLTASFMRLLSIDKGFAPDHVLAVRLSMPAERYATESTRQAAYDRIIAAVRALPGVTAASSTSMLPLAGGGQVNGVAPDGDTRPAPERPNANYRFVAPDYFDALGIAILRGRPFRDDERAADRPAPALVSESTAARLWPGQNPLGKRFSRGLTGVDEQGFEVVGVAADARTTTLDATPPLMVYVPYWWRSRAALSLVIRSQTEPLSLAASVRRVIHGIDPDIAVGDTRALMDMVDGSLAPRRYQVRLFVVFGAAALAIALLGVYGVTAYNVSRRRREMSIRLALGARSGDVLALVMRQSAVPVMLGLAAGAAGAVAGGRFVASLLFEVPTKDPFVIGLVVASVGATGMIATWLAARRTLGVDPTASLREE